MKFLEGTIPAYDLTYNDVFLVPQKTKAGSRFEVNLTTSDRTGNTIPIVVANMNAVAGARMAETVARRGGLVVLPQDMPTQVLEKSIAAVKSAHPYYETPVTLEPRHTIGEAMNLIYKRAHGAIVIVDAEHRPVGVYTLDDLKGRDVFDKLSSIMAIEPFCIEAGLSPQEMHEVLESNHLKLAPVVKDGQLLGMMSQKGAVRASLYQPNLDAGGRLKVAAAVGINGDVRSKSETALRLGADMLVLDTAHGHQQKMLDAVKAVREVSRSVLLVAGNVVTSAATRDLIEAGANIVKVGVGPGAMCTTRMMTGVGRPQFSAVLECARQARSLGGSVWADGGVRHPRDVVLALAAGAGNVMFASWFAGTYESAAEIQRDNDGRLYKENYGMASRRAVQSRSRGVSSFDSAKKELFEEGISSSRMYVNPAMPGVEDIIDHITAGLRSACTYEGALTLDELYEKAVLGIQSTAGFHEGTPLAQSW